MILCISYSVCHHIIFDTVYKIVYLYIILYTYQLIDPMYIQYYLICIILYIQYNII